MASTIDLSGLKHYMDTLKIYGDVLKDFRGIMQRICEEAQSKAIKLYGNHERTDITVDFDNGGKRASIKARGDQVAFYEFGTGKVGDNTYKGDLPSGGVPITVKWEYFYDSGKKVTTKSGAQGWFWDGKFQRGIKSEAEMWETSQYIKQEAHKIIQAYFGKAESGGV